MLALRPLARAAGHSSSALLHPSSNGGAAGAAATAAAAVVAGGSRSSAVAARAFVVQARGLAAAAAAAGDGQDKVVIAEDFKAFEEQTTKADRAIAYFTATWCPPCRTISPVYASLSTKHPGVAFVKVDVDANEEAASKASIRTIPAFYFYRQGKVVGKLVGADQAKLKEQIEDLEATP